MPPINPTAAPNRSVSNIAASTAIGEPRVEDDVPFAGRREVSVGDLLAALSAEIEPIGRSRVVRDEYERLLKKHGLQDHDDLYEDFVRIRVAFEATRAGGLWGIQWRVTDQLPQSDRVWAQWRASSVAGQGIAPKTTAIAECDELSALFAFVSRRIGLSSRSEVGLLWPTSNHTVAVWTIKRSKQTRIVVPTSQIFLDSEQSLGTTGFDPWKQKRIFEYARQDVAADVRMPVSLARYFIAQVRRYGGASQGELQAMRNRREYDQRTTAAGG